MNDEKILDKINEEIVSMTPHNYDEISSKCSNTAPSGGNIRELKPRNNFKRIISLAASFAVIVCAVFAFYASRGDKAVSVIDIDVNPSVEIKADKNDDIVVITPLNEDGKTIIDGMDFEGVSLDIALNALVGSMLRNGFITDTQNAVLVSVSNDDSQKQKELLRLVSDNINSALDERKVSGAVVTQALTQEEKVSALAKEYGISEGKAHFIDYICSVNEERTYEALAGLSICELSLMLESDLSKEMAADTDNNDNSPTTAPSDTEEETRISVSGEVNKETYIGNEKALEIALKDADAMKKQVYDLSVGFDQDNGVLVYEIEFDFNGFEYEYDINALTGSIEGRTKERDDDVPVVDSAPDANTQSTTEAATTEPSQTTTKPSQLIGEKEAKAAALARARVKESAVKNFRLELDSDDGVKLYEVSFYSGVYEYEIEVNAYTGKIISYDRELDAEAIIAPQEEKLISEAEAKEIAAKKAGIKESSFRELTVRKEYDDGKALYELEFISGSYAYEIELDAVTGRVLDYDREYTGAPAGSEEGTTQAAQNIGAEAALKVALDHAGLSVEDISDREIELEKENGRLVYEISFESGRYGYEYEINAATGKILFHEKEFDD